MSGKQFTAILLIIFGSLSLAYGGINYTEETHKVDVGSLHLAVDQERHIDVSVWVSAGLLILGGLMLLPAKKA